jgi:Apea-like HEPN
MDLGLMIQKFFQTKFIVKDLFRENLGHYLHDSTRPMIVFWLADDLLVKQERIIDSETGKYSDQVAFFELIKLSEKKAIKYDNDIRELNKARENHDEKRNIEIGKIISEWQKERIKDAEKNVRRYIEICSLLSNIVPSVTLDMNGTGVIESDRIGKSRVSNTLIIRNIRKPSPEQKAKVTDNFMTFLERTKKASNKYMELILNYQYLQLAIEYAYTSRLSVQFEDYPIQNHQELRAFIDAMVSLEAVFNETLGDISYKLALRCSFLLEMTGFSAGKVFEDLTKAYSKRSHIVHGMKRESLEHQFVEQIQLYAREAVVCTCALGLHYNVNKKTLMEKLDEAMFSPEKEIIREKIAAAKKDFAVA